MTPEDADRDFGPKVFESENFIVRTIERKDGIHVFIHHKIENPYGKRSELIPHGYLLGTNTAMLKKRVT